jgi:hypothetical protein
MRRLVLIRQVWGELKTGVPGSRFLDHYQRQQRYQSGRLTRVVLMSGGVCLIALGSIMLVLPVPSAAVLLLGAAIVASESRGAAHAFDRWEIQIRASLRKLRRRA